MSLNTTCITGTAAAALAIGCLGFAPNPLATSAPTAADDPPETLVLTGVIRDFKERTDEDGGHPDFERRPDRGFGQYVGNVEQNLDADGKPVFNGNGYKLGGQYRNSGGDNICWCLFDSGLGDTAGYSKGSDSGGIDSESSFSDWFRDYPGTNMSKLQDITLVRQADGAYVFDSDVDETYEARDGFFPIDGLLYGNSSEDGSGHNFHFTFELHTEFTYDAEGAQIFTFRGDDDVWVFIDGRMVIDLGGVHGAIEQTVDLNRLELEDGEDYQLSFFFAERHRTQSNFRMTTNLQLKTIELPTVTAAYD